MTVRELYMNWANWQTQSHITIMEHNLDYYEFQCFLDIPIILKDREVEGFSSTQSTHSVFIQLKEA